MLLLWFFSAWDAVMADFKEHVQVIEGMTQTFISEVQNSRDVQSREPVRLTDPSQQLRRLTGHPAHVSWPTQSLRIRTPVPTAALAIGVVRAGQSTSRDV